MDARQYGITAQRTPAGEAIDILYALPAKPSFPQVDRLLFSIANQTYRHLHVTLIADQGIVGALGTRIETFDWSAFPRRPVAVGFAETDNVDASRAARAMRLAEHRFVCVVDALGAFYTRGCQLLLDTARATKAPIVHGVLVAKNVRVLDGFVYDDGRPQSFRPHSANDPRDLDVPFGACLLDRARIRPADLATGLHDEAMILSRLAARYPARPVVGGYPVFAWEREPTQHAPPPSRYAPTGSDRVLRSFREMRRRGECAILHSR